jgi:hypothetical protein
LSRFPELKTEEVSIDKLYELCEERLGKYKIYSDILASKDRISLNEKLLSLKLSDTIGVHQKMQILEKYTTPINRLNKLDFLQLSIKYKMEANWNKDIHLWLRDSFGRLS